VRLGLIADIHANAEGLRQGLEILADCDEVLCAGDVMYQYRFRAEVLDLLDERGVLSISGNHDRTILTAPGHPLRAPNAVPSDALARLAALPDHISTDLGGLRIAMFHGSPWDEAAQCHYIYPDDQRALRRVATVEADVVVLGHTHIPFHLLVGERLVVNPGSVGECRDGTNTLSCAVLDTATRAVEVRRYPSI